MKFLTKIKLLALTLIMLVASLCLSACGAATKIDFKYTDKSKLPEYNTYNEITVDGNNDEAVWETKKAVNYSGYIGGVLHDVSFSIYFADEGMVVSASVLGAPAFYNKDRSTKNNSGIEIYLAPGNASALDGYPVWEIDIIPEGDYTTTKRVKAGEKNKYSYTSVNTYIDVVGIYDGEVNKQDNLGYTVEFMIPWAAIEVDEAPSSIMFDVAVMYCTDEVGERAAWYSIAQNDRPGYSWSNPQTWYRFDENGYVDGEEYGFWNVSKYNDSIIFSGEDKEDVLVKHGWNNGAKYVTPTEAVVGDFYQEVTIFKPSLSNPDLAVYETNKSIESSLSGLLVRLKNGANSGIQFAAHYNGARTEGAFGIRLQEGDWKVTIFTEKQLERYSDPNQGIRIGMLNIGTVVYCYMADDNNVMQLISSYDLVNRDSFTKNSEKLVGLQLNVGAMFKDYKLYKGDDLKTIAYTVNDGQTLTGATVSVTGSILDGAFVLVTPEEGYKVTKFKVNGAEIVDKLYLKVPASTAPSLNIQVECEALSSTVVKNDITLNVTGKLNYSEATPVNSWATLKGDSLVSVKIVDGVLTTKLADGEYVLLIDGFKSETVTVSNGVVSESDIELERYMFDPTNEYWVVTENSNGGYDITSAEGVCDRSYTKGLKLTGATGDDIDYKDGFILDFTYNGVASASSKYFPSINFYSKTGTRTAIQFCQWGTSLAWKKVDPDVSLATLGNSMQFNLNIRIIVSGSTVSLLVEDGGEYVVKNAFYEIGYDVHEISVCYMNDYKLTNSLKDVADWEAWSLTGVKVSPLASIPLTAIEVDKAEISFSNNSAKYGDVVEITITPDAPEGNLYNVVYAVYVNGNAVDFQEEGDVIKASFKVLDYTIEEYVVSVTVTPTEINDFTFNLNKKDANDDEIPLEDYTLVYFEGVLSEYGLVMDGAVSVSLPDGEYKIIINGLRAVSIVIEDGEVLGGSTICLEKAMFDETNTKWTVQNTASGYTVSSNYKDNSNLSNALEIVGAHSNDSDYPNGYIMEFTFNMNVSDSTRSYPAFAFYDTETSRTFIQLCIYNGGLTIKRSSPAPYDVYASLGSVVGQMSLDMRIIVSGSTVTIFVKEGGNYVNKLNVFGVGHNIKYVKLGYYYDTAETWSFSNFKVLPLEYTADVSFEENANAEISISKSSVKLGDKVSVTIVPNTLTNGKALVVKSVKLNNVAIDTEILDGKVKASFIANDLSASSYNITVETEEVDLHEVNLTLKGGILLDGYTTSVIDNVTLKASGIVLETADVNDGEVTLNIPDGEYVLTVNGYLPLSVVIVDGVVTGVENNVVSLAKPIVSLTDTTCNGDNKSRSSHTIGYSLTDGYTITSDKTSYNGLTTGLVDYDKAVEISFHLSVTGVTAQSKLYPAIWVSGIDDTNTASLMAGQICIYNGKTSFKNAGIGSGQQGTNITTAVSDIDGDFTLIVRYNEDDECIELLLSSDKYGACAPLTYALSSEVTNNQVTNAHYLKMVTEIGFYFSAEYLNTEWLISNVTVKNVTE